MAEEPISRSAVILRVLRRTVIGGSDERLLLARLVAEVEPSSDDLVDALVEAHKLSHADPARQRIINVLGMALDARAQRAR